MWMENWFVGPGVTASVQESWTTCCKVPELPRVAVGAGFSESVAWEHRLQRLDTARARRDNP